MQRWQNLLLNSVCTFARYAMRQIGFSLDFCRGSNEDYGVQIIIPQWGKWCPRFWQVIPHWEFRAKKTVHTLPQGVKPSPEFDWVFTPMGILCPEFSLDFTLLGISCLESSLDFTPLGISCLRISSHFTLGGEILPEIQFALLPGMQWDKSDSVWIRFQEELIILVLWNSL